jgi:RNA polymerase sigma factor for flagellar operon FliA
MSSLVQISPRATLAETLGVVEAVLAVLARRLPPHVSREDLASAGKVALVEALLRFDGPAGEARAFCYARVRGAVLDELRRLDPLSRRARTQVTLVRRATAALERSLGRAPTVIEVSQATGLAPDDLRRLDRLAAAAETCSVYVTGEEGELLDAIADGDATDPAETAAAGDVCDCVRAALARLPTNHAHVLRRYHLEDSTLEEIADELGLSKERVRQLRAAAEKRLRADFVVLALWQSVFAQDRE